MDLPHSTWHDMMRLPWRSHKAALFQKLVYHLMYLTIMQMELRSEEPPRTHLVSLGKTSIGKWNGRREKNNNIIFSINTFSWWWHSGSKMKIIALNNAIPGTTCRCKSMTKLIGDRRWLMRGPQITKFKKDRPQTNAHHCSFIDMMTESESMLDSELPHINVYNHGTKLELTDHRFGQCGPVKGTPRAQFFRRQRSILYNSGRFQASWYVLGSSDYIFFEGRQISALLCVVEGLWTFSF